MGSEVSGHGCGPIKTSRGAVKAVLPEGAGSIDPPTGGSDSWESFVVGVVAFAPSVHHVRLVFSDGASQVVKARAVPPHLAFEHTELFHYAVFAVKGCVSNMQGLAKGKVVAQIRQACDESPE
jgi:hypothetical protein